ncbi:MAG: hypothetical protein D6699_07565, partial [Aquificota bacterium]
MAFDPTNPAHQALALQMFIKNSKYVELIVDTAFVVVPTLLGFGAATLIGKGAIGVAREISNSFGYIGLLTKATTLIHSGQTIGSAIGGATGFFGAKLKD